MPKILIAFSTKNKKDRKACTSSVNLKKLIEKRIEKDKEDVAYTVVTLNTKMKLANVVALFNGSMGKLMEHEGVISKETYTINPELTRGKWQIENLDGAKPAKKEKADKETSEEAAPKKKKKKKKKAPKE